MSSLNPPGRLHKGSSVLPWPEGDTEASHHPKKKRMWPFLLPDSSQLIVVKQKQPVLNDPDTKRLLCSKARASLAPRLGGALSHLLPPPCPGQVKLSPWGLSAHRSSSPASSPDSGILHPALGNAPNSLALSHRGVARKNTSGTADGGVAGADGGQLGVTNVPPLLKTAGVSHLIHTYLTYL